MMDAKKSSPERTPVGEFLAEERREEMRFRQLMALARDESCSPERLYGAAWDVADKDVDEQGNPRWISLVLPRRGDEGRERIAGRGEKKDVHSSHAAQALREGGGSAGEAGAARRPDRSASTEGLAGKLRKFLGGESGDGSARTRALREREGKGSLPIRKARPMRSFFRMAIATAALAAAYHFLVQKGWAPPLF